MQTSKEAHKSAPIFPGWMRWISLAGVLLVITGFAMFLETLGQGGGELQLFTMAFGAIILLFTLTWIVVAVVLNF